MMAFTATEVLIFTSKGSLVERAENENE